MIVVILFDGFLIKRDFNRNNYINDQMRDFESHILFSTYKQGKE